ncbi:MAG: hypothetical protein NT010_06225 [Proteobacteria bacterium]|nr:hypothetical protein [Pseudomonadota bacterium]
MRLHISNKTHFLTVALVLMAVLIWPGSGFADADTESAKTGKTFAEQFALEFRILTYGIIQEPSYSTQNPGNNFLQLPRYLGDMELRPDLRFNRDSLELMAKPRMRLEYSAWTGAGMREQGSKWDDDWYVNEWLARVKVRENLFVSYGRENLQWGPSFLFSPSNPFFPDNGRRNPYLEVPGSDFARFVWIPESSWTFSFIANIEEGRNKPVGPDPFEKIYAAKIDYTGRENYASLILSHKEHTGSTIGFMGGWTLTDAVLLYAEGAITEGSRSLYPERDRSFFGSSMQQIYKDSIALKPVLLAGGSYTFDSKGTLTLEYAYNGQGYNDAQADTYYALRRSAGNSLGSGNMMTGLSQMTLGQTANTGLKFLRRNYLLFQYVQNNIKNVIDLTLRWTQNLDDASCQFTTLVTYYLGNHMELFSVGSINGGGKNTEFGSILDYQLMMGIKYTF